MKKKYTRQEITEMADRCFRRCWHCERYEACNSYGAAGLKLFSYASGYTCYEAHDLPWKKGHWCPFWGNKNHPDERILTSLTWDDVVGIVSATKLQQPYELRGKILAANPDIASHVEYCDNSNEVREQYFNKSENHAMFEFPDFNVYCETLRRYRFSYTDSRALYPGANEWIRPMMICYDKKTYKSLCHYLEVGDGLQISFACSPEKNYQLNQDIFLFDEASEQIVAEFRNGHDLVKKSFLQLKQH